MSRVLVSGASGLIGSALVSFLEAQRVQVTRLVRRRPKSPLETRWNPTHPVAPALVSGFDAVVHLSGENVAGIWTEAKKERIRESRVRSTLNLAGALAKADRPPRTFLCASAIGYYGNRGEEILDEASPSGDGFLPEVCREWEFAGEAAADAGIRTINLRIGIVLSRSGGALKPMLVPFRFGLGGKIGDGRQWWSWIHITDLVSAVHHCLQNPAIPPGPVNLVSPNPVTNAEFTRALADLLKRPAALTVPAFAARLLLGEFADEGLLASARVQPKRLLGSGFQFRHPELRAALADLLGRRA